MKYIRTKDGIYNVDDLFPKEYFDYETGKEVRTKQSQKTLDRIDFTKVIDNCIAQAETIEELCDEIVVRPGFSKPFLHDSDKQPLECVKQRAIELVCFQIYGAIWTDKGLIYVAKMNDKGELELL